MVRLKVKEVAEAKGYNMSSLSRASDVSFGTIKRMWRNPYSGATIDTLAKIARVLHVSLSDLVEDTPLTVLHERLKGLVAVCRLGVTEAAKMQVVYFLPSPKNLPKA